MAEAWRAFNAVVRGRFCHAHRGRVWMAVCLFWSANAVAEPTSAPTLIQNLRPYVGNTHVYVTVANSTICGTTVFRLDTSLTGGREAYAALLAAYGTARQVSIEVSACQGWGSPIQSVYAHG
jgi:hypothetical protein